MKKLKKRAHVTEAGTGPAGEARRRLIDAGGRTAQELGFGRILGQIGVYLYLQEQARSLDDIGGELGLSKAAVSVAARQLESLGVVRRVWRQGDRRTYYRTADTIATAMQQGVLAFVRQKLRTVSAELDDVARLLETPAAGKDANPEIAFLRTRVARAGELRTRVSEIMESPWLKLLVG